MGSCLTQDHALPRAASLWCYLMSVYEDPAPMPPFGTTQKGPTGGQLSLCCDCSLVSFSLCSILLLYASQGMAPRVSPRLHLSLFLMTQPVRKGFRKILPLERDHQDSREGKERDLGSDGYPCAPEVTDYD